jgi:hypothetical protein
LAAVVLQRLNRPNLNHRFETNQSKTPILIKQLKITWLMQLSSNVYIPFDPKTLNANFSNSIRLQELTEKARLLEANQLNYQSYLNLSSNNMLSYPAMSTYASTTTTVDIEMSQLSSSQLEPLQQSLLLNASTTNTIGNSLPLTLSPSTSRRNLENMEYGELCVICMSKPASSVIMSCGHAVTCLDCILMVTKKMRVEQCPLCRTPIVSIYGLSHIPFYYDANTNQKICIANVQYFLQSAASSATSSSLNVSPTIAAPIIDNIQPGDMNNATAIGNTVNVQAASNTITYHDSMIDILF